MSEPVTPDEPRTKGTPPVITTPTGRFLVGQGVPAWQVSDVEWEARGDRPRTGEAEAATPTLDVERLAAALDVLSDDGMEYALMAPEEREDRDDAAERLAAEYARLTQDRSR